MVAPQGRLLHGRVLRWLLPVVVLLLAAGVLGMHGLGAGHGLSTTAHRPAHAGSEAATAGHHHGPGLPSLDGSAAHASTAPAAAGDEVSTRAVAPPTPATVLVLDHPPSASSTSVGGAAPPSQGAGSPAGTSCTDDCGGHGAVMAMCLAVLAVALALLLARGPAALLQPWAALPAPTLLRGRHLVLHRAPGLHQLCVSRT